MSLNGLQKLTTEELSTMVIEYQNKFDNMLSSTNAELNFFKGQIYKNGIAALSNKESEQ